MWLFGIARGVIANALRGQVRRSRLADRLRAVTAGPQAQGAPADRGVEVRDAIDRLDPDLAEVVRLVHWDGFTLAEAADVLALSASTVRSRYARARAELSTVLLPARTAPSP
jgi:RNA polymerase sigma factor (sigma-70 family)